MKYLFRNVWDLFTSNECVGALKVSDNRLLTIKERYKVSGYGSTEPERISLNFNEWDYYIKGNYNKEVELTEEGFRFLTIDICYAGDPMTPVILVPVMKMHINSSKAYRDLVSYQSIGRQKV